MSVSRVEYDAALARVIDVRECEPDASGANTACHERLCDCLVLTLAALGLDEPPTEPKPFDVRDHPMAFPSHVDEPPTCSCTADADDPDAATERCPKSERDCGHHCAHSWSHDRCCWCGMEWDESGEVVPPAEPPKACPKCGGTGGPHPTFPCAACNGSGIDGGTA